MEYSQRQRKHLWLYAFVCPAIDRFSRIVQKIAPPEEIFDSPPDALKKYVSEEAIAKMRAHNSESYIDAMLDKLRTRGIDFICRGDDDYPDSFEEVSDIIVPPEVIFLRGARELPGKRALGVVGTRSSTAEGERIAHDFAREFAEYDITTVTGMALGIDSAATQGALDGGGRVVGVLGCGVDVPYPADNQTLVKRMLDNGGTLMSEYLPGTQPNPFYFPIRNRVIAAMCKGSLIIQAPRRSGALNTATHALNCGRDVFVVPGSILDPKFAGSNALLRDGAIPALCARDVMEISGLVRREVKGARREPKPETKPKAVQISLTDDELSVVMLVREREISFDEITSETGFDAARLNSVLTMLKIKGIIDETTGKHYRISGGAD